MLELHLAPNDPWYARIELNGRVVLNPEVPDALARLRQEHPAIAALHENAERRSQVLRRVRQEMRRMAAGGLQSHRQQVEELISQIDEVEPDVAG